MWFAMSPYDRDVHGRQPHAETTAAHHMMIMILALVQYDDAADRGGRLEPAADDLRRVVPDLARPAHRAYTPSKR